ncbi:AraC family transcriptional regulator [Catalinimonas niigatensis]|uniref:AraC family transcriptional regulator n=1 Tax=Catalinimonas niigatensis TaxID=1397264 RepID=UPI002666D2E9|nr:AraC family transcriptional regulator [Catalinimonas niigatensis]WPP50364.1 AraC family transcriptional regulator ligand-binding domain-containing protein [Catalinimonas niigatensis]
MKILAIHLYSLLDYAQARGLKLESLTQGTSLQEVDLSAAEATVNEEDYYLILERIMSSLEDEHLGIRMGSFLKLQALGLIYQISLQCTTIEEAIHYLKDFVQATLPLVQITTHLGEQQNTISANISNKQHTLNRQLLECLLVIISRELRMMSRDRFPMHMTSPFYTSAYPEPFMYGEVFTLSFSGLDLKAALKSYHDKHLDFLIPQYLKLIQTLKKKDSFMSQVKIAALHKAKPELPGLEEIADSFHLTPRTFQRILAREKVTFRQLSDELKKEISMLLLQHKSYSIGDISYILGYSEPAAFVHTFRKWYGDTPTHLRRYI